MKIKEKILNAMVWIYYRLMPDFIKKIIYKLFDYLVAGYRIKKAKISTKKHKDMYVFQDKKNNIRFEIASSISKNDLHALIWYFQHYQPKKGDIVIDGWAFHGLISIYLAHLVGEEGKVFSFEPDPVNYKILKENIQLNWLKNIIAINKWLWSHQDTLHFSRSGIDSSVFVNNKNKHDTIDVEVVNPLEEIKKHGYDHIDFIKTDIEWAEIEMLRWLEPYMKKHPIQFAIASYHIVPWEKYQTYRTLEALFTKAGYYSETQRPWHLTTYAYRK